MQMQTTKAVYTIRSAYQGRYTILRNGHFFMTVGTKSRAEAAFAALATLEGVDECGIQETPSQSPSSSPAAELRFSIDRAGSVTGATAVLPLSAVLECQSIAKSSSTQRVMTPVRLEVLLHFYYCPEPHLRYRQSSAVREAVQFLLKQELIENSDEPEVFRATAKGAAYIRHLLQVPLPVNTWAVPK